MDKIFLFLAAAIILIYLVLQLKVYVRVFKKYHGNDFLTVEIYLFKKFIIYRKNISYSKSALNAVYNFMGGETNRAGLFNFAKIKRFGKICYNFIDRLKDDINVEKFFLRARFSLGDAASAALLSALLQVILSQTAFFLTGGIKKSAVISITPDFTGDNLKMEVECILSVKTANVIKAAIESLKGKGR